jgi:4-carboxymuconolactone decarboxylase
MFRWRTRPPSHRKDSSGPVRDSVNAGSSTLQDGYPDASAAGPRIPPLRESEWDETQRLLIQTAAAGRVAAINATLARCPRVLELVTALGRELRSEQIPARDREIAILRTGAQCASDYVVAEHRRIGLTLGLTVGEVRSALLARSGFRDDSFDTVICQLVDELHASNQVSDNTWQKVATRYDYEQSIQMVTLIGFYHMLSYFLNAIRVPLDQPS